MISARNHCLKEIETSNETSEMSELLVPLQMPKQRVCSYHLTPQQLSCSVSCSAHFPTHFPAIPSPRPDHRPLSEAAVTSPGSDGPMEIQNGAMTPRSSGRFLKAALGNRTPKASCHICSQTQTSGHIGQQFHHESCSINLKAISCH